MFDLFAIFIPIQVVLAFMLCFFGYKQIRLLISFYAFEAGFLACHFLIANFALSGLAHNIICIIAGLILSGLTYSLYRIAMFAAGAGLGLVAGILICHSFGIPPFETLGLVILGALAVAAAALSVGYKRLVLILSTSICGGLLLSINGGYFVDRFAKIGFDAITSTATLGQSIAALGNFFDRAFPYLMGATVVLAAAGMILQFKKNKGKK